METQESLTEHYRRMRADLTASIEGLSEAQLTATTLDGWSVKDNLAHIAFWDDLRAEEIGRISRGFESVLKMSPEQDDALNEMAYDLRRGLSLFQVLWELRNSGERLFAAIGGAAGRGLDAKAYGEAGLVSHHGALHAGYIRAWRERQGI